MTDLATWHPWKRPGDTPPDSDCRILITFMWRGAMWTDAGRYLAGRFMASDGTLIPESDILGWSDRPLYGAPAL